MAGVFAKALGRLDSTPLEAVADTLQFETIEPSRLADRLELKKHGAERGKRSDPSGDTQSFDSIEHTILEEIENYRRRAVDRVSRELEAYSARLRAFDFEDARLRIISAINTAKGNFAAEVHQGANELHQKRRAVLEATRDVDEFRTRHGIRRQAHLPENRTLIIGIVAALFFAEVAMNALLFASGLAGGAQEGFSTATALGALNVLVGFGAGLFVVRFLLYRNPLVKAVAALGLVADLAVASFLNLGVGRFRSALNSADPEGALATAFSSPVEVFTNIGQISGFLSYVLVALGILFHVIAMLEGFKFDDPYPFYGRYWRKRADAETDYAETKEHLIQFLTAQRDETISEMQDASRSLATSRKLAGRIAENRVRHGQRFEAYIDLLERIANQLLSIYREENAAHRATPVPAHFKTSWSFPSRASLGAPAGPDLFAPNDDIATRTQEDLETGIVEVSEAYVEAVTTYKKIETMLEQDIDNGPALSAAA